MKYCIFDTESTNLFDYALPADAEGQPRLLHFAAFLIDDDHPGAMTVDYYVKPEGFTIDEDGEAFKVNGLSQAKLDAEGVPIRQVLDEYVTLIDEGYVLVAYNAQHDMKQMRSELRRAEMDDRFERSPNICLMRMCGTKAVGVVKPDGGRGWPKLVHAAKHFNITIRKQHEGLSDAAMAYEIFEEIRKRGLLYDPAGKVHFAKDRPIPANDEQKKMDF